jgi:hypothetical protein
MRENKLSKGKIPKVSRKAAGFINMIRRSTMKKQAKAISLALMAILTVSTLSACNGTNNNNASTGGTTGSTGTGTTSTATSEDDTQPIKLTVSWSTSDGLTDIPNPSSSGNNYDVLQAWHSLHPNVTLNAVTNTTDSVIAMYAAGNAPDVVRVDAWAEFPTYASRNMLLPIDSYVAADKTISLSDAFPIMDMFMWDGSKQGTGKLYGIIKDWGPDTGLFINKSCFTAAGLTVPTVGQVLSFDELATDANKMTIKASNGSIPSTVSPTGPVSSTCPAPCSHGMRCKAAHGGTTAVSISTTPPSRPFATTTSPTPKPARSPAGCTPITGGKAPPLQTTRRRLRP